MGFEDKMFESQFDIDNRATGGGSQEKKAPESAGQAKDEELLAISKKLEAEGSLMIKGVLERTAADSTPEEWEIFKRELSIAGCGLSYFAMIDKEQQSRVALLVNQAADAIHEYCQWRDKDLAQTNRAREQFMKKMKELGDMLAA